MGEGQPQDNGALFPMWANSAGPRWRVHRLLAESAICPERVGLIKRGLLQPELWPHIRGPTVMTVLVRKLGALSWGRTDQGTRGAGSGSPPPPPALYQFPPPSSCKQKAAGTWGPEEGGTL